MTPAEHYERAEHWISMGASAAEEELDDEVVRCLMAAQVHATLATVDADVLWPLRTVEAKFAEPVEPHARQRAAVNWPPCEACDHPASRHDLTSDIPPKGGWNDLIEPCQIDDCGCLGYLGEEN